MKIVTFQMKKVMNYSSSEEKLFPRPRSQPHCMMLTFS